jgi:Uma2 family endonuclease
MSAALKPYMTLNAFLDWEDRQPVKYEFDGFFPVAMVGVRHEHSVMQGNLLRHLGNGLAGKPCRAHGSDLKIQAWHAIRYPDAFVVCSPVPRGTTVITDPVIVFEILSDSTAETDRIRKNEEYRNTPSIQRYVMLEQTSMAATVFHRAGNDWTGHLIIGDTELSLPEIGLTLRLADIYDGVEFPPPEPGSDEDLAAR